MMRVNKRSLAAGLVVREKRRIPPRRTRDEVKSILEEAFRKEFPQDTVDVSDGYADNIHVMVVSKKFDGMRDRVRQDWMWKVVDGTALREDEKHLISLLYPVSPTEIH